MMYTISRGPSKLVTQRRTGRDGALTQCDITAVIVSVQRLTWIKVGSRDGLWKLLNCSCLSGPTQQIESKFSDLKLKPPSWLSTK